MCGITGGVSQRDVAPILVEGLRRLEYRGYDSAGLCIVSPKGVDRVRVCGKVKALSLALEKQPLSGTCGIAHTRWATHGEPDERNAHPHMSGESLSLVHNGIIENYQILKEELSQQGVVFESETDTEVVAHLLTHHLEKNGGTLLSAMKACVKKLKGAYALAVVHQSEPNSLVVARQGSPLVIGLGFSENFVASDMLALLPVTQKFMILEEGDIGQIFNDKIDLFDANNNPVQRDIKEVQMTAQHSEKGKFRHFMQKEIFEQPVALKETLFTHLQQGKLEDNVFGEPAKEIFAKVKQVHIVACGTSYHAGMVAAQWFESLLGLQTRVEIASEMRHQRPVVGQDTLFVTLSQSGETADTLAALRSTKQNSNYLASLCICNVPESSLVRESDLVFLTQAGPEIGVCSTKAFTTQLVALLLLCLDIGRRISSNTEVVDLALSKIGALAHYVEQALTLDETIKDVAERFADKHHALFLGRGSLYPIAKEGALKLKEISYIHAESYPAGELKHGPLALVDKEMPVVAIACNDHLIDKLKSNLEEVKARHGQLIIFATKDACLQGENLGTVIEVEAVDPLLAPLVLSIPIQLLAYHVAVIKGTDVDQPRNLAKSVTVE